MNKPVDLSIVIVNYNTPDYTAQCLDSIAENPPACTYEIVVVDNASSDNSADWLAEHYPDVNLIRSTENRGIAGGNNIGINASKGNYILLLNNDTLVLPGSLDRVVQFLEATPEAGGVGGQLLNPDGSYQSGAYRFASLGQVFLSTSKIGPLFRSYYPSLPPDTKEREVDWMSTAFMLFRRESLEEVGLVDEEFFIYSDEPDLQYRMKQAGWRIYHLPDVKTIHFGGKSLNPWRRRKMVYRGWLLFFYKHYGPIPTALLRAMFACICALKIPLWAVTYLLPSRRDRSKQELDSNLDILQMCFHRGVVPPG